MLAGWPDGRMAVMLAVWPYGRKFVVLCITVEKWSQIRNYLLSLIVSVIQNVEFSKRLLDSSCLTLHYCCQPFFSDIPLLYSKCREGKLILRHYRL
jgi:hypothetical protein